MKKKTKQNIIILSVFAFLVLVAVGVVVYAGLPRPLPSNDDLLAGNTGGNLVNGGLFCEANGKVYFSNSFDGGNLYVMNPDETDIKKIGSFNAFSINVGGDFIYLCQYVSSTSGGYRLNPGLYRLRTNGKDVVNLKLNPIWVAALCGNEIYFQNHDNSFGITTSHVIGVDGENERQFSSDLVNPANYVDGIIYYANASNRDHFIRSYNVATGENTVILEGNFYNVIYDNGYLYYMDIGNNYCLRRLSLADGTIETLVTERVEAYNVAYGTIIYQNYSTTNPVLTKMNDDGSEPVVIAQGNFTKINFTSQYAYFRAFGDDTMTFKVRLAGEPTVSAFIAASNAVE
jgi:hypothetical protein